MVSLQVLDAKLGTVRNETQQLATICNASDHEATIVTFRLLEERFLNLQKDAHDLLTVLKVWNWIVLTNSEFSSIDIITERAF